MVKAGAVVLSPCILIRIAIRRARGSTSSKPFISVFSLGSAGRIGQGNSRAKSIREEVTCSPGRDIGSREKLINPQPSENVG